MPAVVDVAAARTRALEAAETLFYARGVQSVGMDEVRAVSGLSLKRLYQLFPSKADLVEAYLRARDTRWRESLARYVAAESDPRQRPLAVFDWLYLWFSEPDFRGCAFINAFGELGATSTSVTRAVSDHKEAFRAYLADLVSAATAAAAAPVAPDAVTGVAPGPAPDPVGTLLLAEQLALLAEGAMTTAAISGSAEPARHARAAARVLLRVEEPAPATTVD